MKYFKLILICFIWSTTWAVIKIGLDRTPLMVGLALRFSVATIALGVIIFLKRRKIALDRVSVQNYLVVGLLTMALSFYCTYWAEKFIPSGLTSILWTAMPIVVGIFAHFMLPDERLRLAQVMAILIAMAGVIVILSDRQLVFDRELLWGSVVALFGVVVSSWPNVLLKTRPQPYDSLTMTAMAMLIAALVNFIGATVGGEWQKMAIARAYMREAEVLILDEPTAALDARSEFEVFKRFKELSEGKTAILISHRFSSVRMADRILVLADGKVEAAGIHDELVAQSGRYAELFELQAAGYR